MSVDHPAGVLITRGPRYAGGLRLSTRQAWTPSEVGTLRTLVEVGVDPSEAANILGRSESSIAWRARESGLFLPPQWKALVRAPQKSAPVKKTRRRPRGPLEKNRLRNAEICALYGRGLTMRAIAERVGIAHQNVYVILKSNGVTGKHPGRRRSLDFSARGQNWRDVAKDTLLRLLYDRGRNGTEILRLTNDEAYSVFLGTRYPYTNGSPVCPACGASDARMYVKKARTSQFNCINLECNTRFCITDETIVHRSSLSWRNKLQLLSVELHEEKLTPTQLFMRLDVPYMPVAYKYVHKTGGILRPWRDLRRSNLPERYHTSRSLPNNEIMLAILMALPSRLPPEMRDEVLQEMTVAILTGELALADIQKNVEKFVLAYNRNYGWAGRRSLSEFVFDDGSRTLGDTLVGENSFEYWERR